MGIPLTTRSTYVIHEYHQHHDCSVYRDPNRYHRHISKHIILPFPFLYLAVNGGILLRFGGAADLMTVTT